MTGTALPHQPCSLCNNLKSHNQDNDNGFMPFNLADCEQLEGEFGSRLQV